MTGILYTGDNFSTILPGYSPVISNVNDYDHDRTRYHKVYSYRLAEHRWVYRISDDPKETSESTQGRLV